MKILAIIGSPRGKGNCYKLTRKVEEKMSLLGNVEFEYLFLKDVDLKPCRGCGLCYLKGENLCPLKDDRAAVEQKMAEADGVVFATPTYVLNVSGIMKNFIDRFAYVSHRPRFFKPALVVSTTGAVGLETTLFMLGLMAGSWGFNITHKLGVITPYNGDDYVQKDMKKYAKKAEKNIDRSAKKFYSALASGKRAPGVLALAQFRLRKASFLKEETDNVDRIYFEKNGWMNKGTQYFYDAKINAIEKGTAGILASIMGKFA